MIAHHCLVRGMSNVTFLTLAWPVNEQATRQKAACAAKLARVGGLCVASPPVYWLGVGLCISPETRALALKN